jgi:hypothetical protein
VNVMQRVLNGGGVIPAMRSTGGAVVLNSLTTTLGYLALLGSVNQAVRSLGLIAVLGELSCLVAAMIFLPSWLLWRDFGYGRTGGRIFRPARRGRRPEDEALALRRRARAPRRLQLLRREHRPAHRIRGLVPRGPPGRATSIAFTSGNFATCGTSAATGC